MTLPDFSDSKSITYTLQVDSATDPNNSPYDIILGSDFLFDLGITLNYKQHHIEWDNDTTPLKVNGHHATTENIYQSPLLREMELRQDKILEADYSKVDIDAMVNELQITTASKEHL